MSASDVVLIATGGANIASLQFALDRLGASSRVSVDPVEISAASHVILPGVGAAADAMQRLHAAQLEPVIRTLTQPVLGICLGMQLLHAASDEGATQCLSVMPGCARRFADLPGRPVPHMGWNTLTVDGGCALFDGLETGCYAYFVHSYALPVTAATIATTDYGISFSAGVRWNNFFGVQFHPERSATVGARILQNFLNL